MRREEWETGSRKSLVGAFIFAAILLFAGSYFYLKNEEKVWSNQALKQLKNTSVLKARQVEAWRQERLADAREIGQSPLLQDAVSNWINHPDKNALKDEIQQRLQIVIQNNPDCVNILVTDAAGKPLLAGKPGTTDLATPSTGQLVHEVVQTNNEIFGDLYKSSPEGAIYADIACPIRTDSHKIVGAILFRIDPNLRLLPILRSGSDESTEESFLFEKSGDSVLYLTNLSSRPNSALSLKIPLTNNGNPAHSAENKIFSAAYDIFLLYGYHGTKLRQIADQAGVRASVIHYYFRSKERLYEAVVKETLDFVISTKFDFYTAWNKLEKPMWFLSTERYNNRDLFESTLKHLYPEEWAMKLKKIERWFEIRKNLESSELE
jgi:hypothetical protein